MAETVKSRECVFSVSQSTSLSVNDDCLDDGEGFVQATRCVQLALLSFHIDVELVNPLQSQLFLLENNLNGIPHELLGSLKHIGRHCSLPMLLLSCWNMS